MRTRSSPGWQFSRNDWSGMEPVEARPWPIWKVFTALFILTLMLGVGYTFLRTPIYRSTATLLIAPPAAFAAEQADSGSRYVAVQSQILLSRQILDQVWEHLAAAEQAFSQVDKADVKKMLSVEMLPENIVQLHVSGEQQDLLAPLAQAWLEVYQRAQGKGVAGEEQATLDSLAQESSQLASRLEEKRNLLDTYAATHNITSTVREENEALSQLSGLSTSLAEASGAVVKARARLQSLQDAAERGEYIAEGEIARELAAMKGEASRLKGKLGALRQRYTQAYMNRDPAIIAMREDYELLTTGINEVAQESHRESVNAARRELEEAEVLMQGLQAQLSESDDVTRAFSERFSRYEEMQRELERLEELAHSTEERLMAESVGNRNRAPQITLLDWPQTPTDPIYPAYQRDALISLAAALAIALLGSWIYLGSLRSRVWMWPADTALSGQGLPPGAWPASGRIGADAQGRLPYDDTPPPRQLVGHDVVLPPRSLTDTEVKAMLAVANDATRLLIVTLLSGVKPEELSLLCRNHIDLETGRLDIPGRHQRSLQLSAEWRRIAERALADLSAEQAWWSDGLEQSLSLSELESMLCCAAIDAGLMKPADITVETMHMTYLVFLASQGLRLGELRSVVGSLSSEILAQLAQCAPADRGLSRQQIELDYPL